MILDTHKIMDYWVTDDPAVLDAFIVHVRERYTALEQALEPITVTVNDLERDWKPRWEHYWQTKMAALLSLRTAAHAALQVFDREQSSEDMPIPIIFAGISLGYRFGLHTVESKIEEAGILLTSYIEVCSSHEEQHLRQRQRVLNALQEVVKATREATNEGRDKLAEDSREQKLTVPRPTRRTKQKETSGPTTDEAATTTEQPSLHVVRAEEVQP